MSMAATITRSSRLLGHPAPDRIVAAGEVPGVVGVQALDAVRVPPTPPAGAAPSQSAGTAASRSAA